MMPCRTSSSRDHEIAAEQVDFSSHTHKISRERSCRYSDISKGDINQNILHCYAPSEHTSLLSNATIRFFNKQRLIELTRTASIWVDAKRILECHSELYFQTDKKAISRHGIEESETPSCHVIRCFLCIDPGCWCDQHLMTESFKRRCCSWDRFASSNKRKMRPWNNFTHRLASISRFWNER